MCHRPALVLFTLTMLTGCNRTEPYAAVYREQVEAQKQVTEVLASVTDEASMEKAREKLRRKWYRFEEIKKKALALPKPSESVKEQLAKEFAGDVQESWAALRREINRVRDLPGGEKFLESFESAKKARKDP